MILAVSISFTMIHISFVILHALLFVSSRTQFNSLLLALLLLLLLLLFGELDGEEKELKGPDVEIEDKEWEKSSRYLKPFSCSLRISLFLTLGCFPVRLGVLFTIFLLIDSRNTCNLLSKAIKSKAKDE